MRAYRLNATISEDQKIVFDLPLDLPAGRAEVLVLVEDEYEECDDEEDLQAFREAKAEYEASGRQTKSFDQICEEMGI